MLFFSFPEYFTDLEGRNEQDSSLPWDFYSSSLFGKKARDVSVFLSQSNALLEFVKSVFKKVVVSLFLRCQ